MPEDPYQAKSSHSASKGKRGDERQVESYGERCPEGSSCCHTERVWFRQGVEKDPLEDNSAPGKNSTDRGGSESPGKADRKDYHGTWVYPGDVSEDHINNVPRGYPHLTDGDDP